MKYIICNLLLLLFSASAYAQTPALNAFYSKHKKYSETIALTLPGWLVGIGANIAATAEEMDFEEMIEYQPLLRKLHSVKVLVNEDNNSTSTKEINQLKLAIEKDGFVRILELNDEGEKVHVLLRERKFAKNTKRNFIKNIVLIVEEKNELVVVGLNGRWKKRKIQKILRNTDFLEELADL